MEARTREILETGLRDYIKTGEPITSERLYKFYDFGIKPAMIRRELNDLAEAGYLYQPHPSAGRLPTDKAYRVFIEKLLTEEETDKPSEQLQKMGRSLFHGNIASFVEDLAKSFGLLSIGYDPAADSFWNSGLESLLTSLDEATKEDFLAVVNDFSSLPGRLSRERALFKKEDVEPQIFVGANPLTRSECLSVLASRVDFDGEEIILMTIGPKRMDYQKPIRLFRYLNKAKK